MSANSAEPEWAAVAGALLRHSFGSGMRREEPGRALAYWSALSEGKLSPIDFTDNGGKRFVLAQRILLGATGPRVLSAAERQVVWYVAQGHAQKLVAYELGYATSTVSELLRSGLAKLGLRSRAELLVALGRRERDPVVPEAELSAPRDLEVATFSIDRANYVILAFVIAAAPPKTLSPAEQVVTRGILAGKSSAAIAKERGVSPYTVTNQLRSIFAKLGVHGCAELIQHCNRASSAKSSTMHQPAGPEVGTSLNQRSEATESPAAAESA